MSSVVRALSVIALLTGSAIELGGCASASIGAGVSNVTLETIHVVCLSHKDTPYTITQVAENNGALKALGAPKPNCKPR